MPRARQASTTLLANALMGTLSTRAGFLFQKLPHWRPQPLLPLHLFAVMATQDGWYGAWAPMWRHSYDSACLGLHALKPCCGNAREHHPKEGRTNEVLWVQIVKKG